MFYLELFILILFALGVLLVEHGVMDLARRQPSERVLKRRIIPPEKYRSYATIRGMAQLIGGIGAVFLVSMFFGGTIAVILVMLCPVLLIIALGMLIALMITYKRRRDNPDDPFAF